MNIVLLVASIVLSAGANICLRDAAKGKVFVGAAGNYWNLKKDSTYARMLGEQYDLVTAENGCKFSSVSKTQSTYDFTQCDYIMQYATNHSMAFRYHTLVWGNQNPSWLVDGHFSASQKRQIIHDHIEHVFSHYDAKPYAWDVVNEAVADSNRDTQLFKDNVWYPDVPDYVEYSFQCARAASPSAKLFYNDYNILQSVNWMKGKADAVFDMVKGLKEKNLIDGIGFQSHINAANYPMDLTAIRSNFQRYQDLGLDIHITELDIKTSNNDELNKQATMYSQLLDICLSFPSCKSFQTWGFTDKYTWIGTDRKPLPFDTNFQPKQAAFNIEAGLQHAN